MNTIRICNCSTCVEKRLADSVLSPNSKLVHLRRVGVGELSGEPTAAAAVREVLFASLCSAKRWVVMEHAARADAVFKGHIQIPGTNLGAGVEDLGLTADDSVTALARMAVMAHAARQQVAAVQRGAAELTLRLTTHSGIVLWASSQQIANAKGRSVGAEMVERAMRHLMRTIDHEEEEIAPMPQSQAAGNGLAALNRVLHEEDETVRVRVSAAASA